MYNNGLVELHPAKPGIFGYPEREDSVQQPNHERHCNLDPYHPRSAICNRISRDLLQVTVRGKNPVTGADTFLSEGCVFADAGSYASR